MRRVLVVLAVLLVVLAAAAVFAARNLDSYVNRNRESIAQQVEGALGREVEFGEVGISFAGGLGVRVEDLRVGDDPAFSKEDFLSAGAVDVQVAILPALFGRIEVARVVLREPRVRLIQTRQGLSIESLGSGAGGGAPGEAAPEAAAPGEAAEPGAAPGGGTALLVSLLNIEDGEVRFEDRTAKPPVELAVTHLDVEASDISLSQPVAFEMRAAILGADAQNLRASGRVGPFDAEAPRADVDLQLDRLALGQALALPGVREALPPELSASGSVSLAAKAEGTAEALAFQASVDAKEAALRFGDGFDKPAGQAASIVLRGKREGAALSIESAELRLLDAELHASASLSGGEPQKLVFRVDAEELRPATFGAGAPEDVVGAPVVEGTFTLPTEGPRGRATLRSASGKMGGGEYRNLVADVATAARRVTLEKLEVDAFEGQLAARGRYDASQATPRFSLSANLAGLQVEPLIAATGGGPAPLTGTIHGSVDLAGAGSGWEEIEPRLGASGNVRITDGVLRQFNPAGGTLDFLANLPVVSAQALRQVMRAHPRAFGEEDAPFDVIETVFELSGGWIDLRRLVLTTEEYDITGSGRYSLDGEAKIETQLTFAQAVSEELVTAEPYLRYARMGDGRVQVPVAIRGTTPKLGVLPDVSRLGQTAARQAITEQILDAAGLGKPAATAPGDTAAGQAGDTATAPGAQPGEPPKAEDVGRELLRQGLEGLLGGQRKPAEPAPGTQPSN
jgi:hypothetical protein